MTAWWNLTKKELRLGLPAFLLPLITYALLASVMFYVGSRQSMNWGMGWEMVMIVSVAVMVLHLFYLVYYFYYSLQSERKRMHLWLHNPLPGYALLSAKLTAGIVSMIGSLLIIGAVTAFSYFFAGAFADLFPALIWGDVINLGLLGGVHLFLIALNFALYFLFFWMIFLLISRYIGSFFSIILTFILFLCFVSGWAWLTETPFFRFLTEWGEINLVQFAQGLQFSADATEGISLFVTDIGAATIYLGTYVIEALMAIAVFAAACWLLDRKVEV
ncbi:hypothetical protein M3212_08480 [Alkalihalobacillus oceani]|uniref:hypothetical protein n=1 Tax=Halalkalibacter oceani TaxID=1653776 RepID=UPI00203E0C6B|nr:hypothetical protein [Halalkalibacter oceani]MCM3760824.1 hypothetical protein [Halalkalibacter oceani]